MEDKDSIYFMVPLPLNWNVLRAGEKNNQITVMHIGYHMLLLNPFL